MTLFKFDTVSHDNDALHSQCRAPEPVVQKLANSVSTKHTGTGARSPFLN